MSVDPWFAQPKHPLGTAILLPGRMGGIATPLLHWPAALLTQIGWSVLGVRWDENRLSGEGAASQVRRCADAALNQASSNQPVLVVAKSLGTLALPWAVENRLPGVWLTPLLQDTAVVRPSRKRGSRRCLWVEPTTLLGNNRLRLAQVSRCWSYPTPITVLQQPGDWRRSLLHQIEIFDRVSQLAEQVLNTTT